MKLRIKRNPYNNIVKILLVWIMIQDFVLSLLYTATGARSIVVLLFYMKDIILMGLTISVLLKNIKVSKEVFASYMYIVLIFIYGFITLTGGNITITALLHSIRSLILFPCFFVIGAGVQDVEDINLFFDRSVLKLVMISCVFGIIDYFLDEIIGTKNVWTNVIGIGNFMTQIKGQENTLVQGLPGNFYGSYGGEYFSQKRLVGMWASPLTAAYWLVLPWLYCFIKIVNKEKRYMSYLILFTISIMLTRTRAIILTIILIGVFWGFKNSKIFRQFSVVGLLFALLFVFNYRTRVASFLYDGSTAGHMIEFFCALSEIKFFGGGLGTFGIISVVNNIYGAQGTESAYLSIAGQMGWGMLAFFMILYFVPLFKIKRSYHKTVFENLIITSAIVFAITGIISEQLLAYTSIAQFYIWYGMVFQSHVERRIV